MSETKMSCCGKPKPSDDEDKGEHVAHSHKIDKIYATSLGVILLAFIANLFSFSPLWIRTFATVSGEILLSMWWGVAIGIFVMGVMNKVPRTYFTGLLGRSDSHNGLLRAAFAGVILDLCSHGILMVAAKLYERGVSLPQVVTFLVASPWNSISITMILITLIGVKWALLYIAGSIMIALLTGYVFQILVNRGHLPQNPHQLDIPDDYKLWPETKTLLKSIKFTRSGMKDMIITGWRDGQMIIKWLLFGTILAAASRTFIPADMFAGWFGPTIIGLLLTVVIATVIEICSEGSAPMAGEFVNQAAAPGNGFAFLMAGVATDYTEILVVREFTKSWKAALFLPLVSVPQVIFIAWLMNISM